MTHLARVTRVLMFPPSSDTVRFDSDSFIPTFPNDYYKMRNEYRFFYQTTWDNSVVLIPIS